MAAEAGLNMPEVRLFPAKKGSGYFAVLRFDRIDIERLHMHTASGILHSDFRTLSLDYEDLLALAMILTKDVREVEKFFRLAGFNVLARNRDDRGKNFSFLMDNSCEWKVSPPYDLTFSPGPRGEQSTMVMGEGKNPVIDALIEHGRGAKISQSSMKEIIEQTKNALSNWSKLAATYGVSRSNIALVKSKIEAVDAEK